MLVEWSGPAVQDLENIQDYIARDSEHYAARYVSRLVRACDVLADFPRLGRPVPEAASGDIRQIIVDNYRVIYRVEKRVLILAIIHGKRDLSASERKPWDLS